MASALVVTSILFALLSTGTASANHVFTGDKVVGSGQVYQLTIIMPTAGPLPFTVDVYSGPSIDIVLVDGFNLQLFKDGRPYTYYQGGTFFDSYRAVGNAWLEAGTYYLIFVNEHRFIGNGPATVHYSYTPTSFGSGGIVSGGSDQGPFSGPIVILLLIAVMVIAAIGMISYLAHNGRREARGEQFRPTAPGTNASDEVRDAPKFCRYCGNLLSSNGPYCPKCGKSLD